MRTGEPQRFVLSGPSRSAEERLPKARSHASSRCLHLLFLLAVARMRRCARKFVFGIIDARRFIVVLFGGSAVPIHSLFIVELLFSVPVILRLAERYRSWNPTE